MSRRHLFPAPTTLSHHLVPRHYPGSTPASLGVLLSCLEDNHDRWHVYFHEQGFHNHIAHHLLTLYALGAPAAIIKRAYALESAWQRPISLGLQAPEVAPITDENFFEHLGDERYFKPYVDYFQPIVESMGPIAAIEKFVYTLDYNHRPKLANGGKEQPDMLTRHMAAILHPLIQTGFGVEFGIPGLVAEGLAQTAVHELHTSVHIPFFDPSQLPQDAGAAPNSSSPHALNILQTLLSSKEPVLKPPNPSSQDVLIQVFYDYCMNAAPFVLPLVDEWLADVIIMVTPAGEAMAGRSDELRKKLEQKFEEIVWANSVMYGVGGWAKGQNFNADFFLMHIITSAILIPSFLATLRPASSINLLKAFFSSSLMWFIGRGRPAIDLAAFFEGTTHLVETPLNMPISTSIPYSTELRTATQEVSTTASIANPWTPILESSITHPDEHLPKLQRALAHFASLYGHKSFGRDAIGISLPGVSTHLDGSLFLRVAALSAIRMENDRKIDMNEVQGAQWDRMGLFGL